MDTVKDFTVNSGTVYSLSSAFSRALTRGDVCLTGKEKVAISQPDVVKEFLAPLSEESIQNIQNNREFIHNKLHDKETDRLLIVVGPGEVTDINQIRNCSKWLSSAVDQCDYLRICLRVNTPTSFCINNGLVNTRQVLVDQTVDFPLAGTISDELVYLYFNDTYSLSFFGLFSGLENIGSRLPTPVAIESGEVRPLEEVDNLLDKFREPQSYISLRNSGQVGVTHTLGNEDCILVFTIGAMSDLQELLSYYDGRHCSIKLLISLGRVNKDTMVTILDVVKGVLRSILFRYLIGFVVDSGTQYQEEITDDGSSMRENISYKEVVVDISGASKRASLFRQKVYNSFKSSYHKISALTGHKKSREITSEEQNYSLDLIFGINQLFCERIRGE